MALPSSDLSKLQFCSIVFKPLGNARGCGIQFLNAAHKKGTCPPEGLERASSLGRLFCKGLHLRLAVARQKSRAASAGDFLVVV